MNDSFKVRVWNVSGGYYLPEFYLTPAGEVCEFGVFNGTPKVRKFDNQENYRKERCTGLCDKNGKLIFEGDYIRFEWTFKDNEVCKVVWDRKHCQFTCYDAVSGCEFITWYTAFENGSSYRCEIIGNIHEMEVEK